MDVVNGREATHDQVRKQLGQFTPRLRRFALVLTRSQVDADDLVQSTFERALAYLPQWEPGTRLDSWLYRIAQNLWIDQRRRAQVRGSTESADEMVLTGEDGREESERQLMVRDAIRAGGPLPVDPHDALKTIRVIEAARASATSGQVIPFDAPLPADA